MNPTSKISKSFEAFLSAADPKAEREAVVIYQPLAKDIPNLPDHLMALKRRLDHVKAFAAAQQPVQERLSTTYRKAAGPNVPFLPIGANTLPVATTMVTRKLLPALAEQPDVLAIIPNQKIQLIRPKEVAYATLARNEAEKKLTWGLEQLQVPKLWETTKGKDVHVAVLDTGVHGGHPALNGKIKDFVVVDPLGTRITTSQTFDSDEHGTHVCGTIAGGQTASGVAIGIAPEANLYVGAVLIGNATLATLLAGISWAVQKGAQIVNMSLGFTYYEPNFTQVFDILINQYRIIPVVAIGNENHGNTSSPGSAHNALSVGALEKMPQRQIDVAFFSGGASLVFPGQEPNALVHKPDVVAPGVQVYSAIPPKQQAGGVTEYAYMDGTSMATPHVAGVAALLRAAKPSAPISAIMEVIKATAKHPGGANARPDNRWGFSLIQPVEALKALS